MSDGVIHLSYPLSFLAGLVSFLSPCVFPLVPAYLGYLGGRAGEGTAARQVAPRLAAEGPGLARDGVAEPRAAVSRVPVMANGVAFVLGFSAVFITLFYVLRALDVTVVAQHRRAVDVVAGTVVIILGLWTLGILRIAPLMRERRRLVAPAGAGIGGAFVLGVTFAAGWTPCIGAQLGAILTVASQGDFAGLPVMVAYCLGLAVPFLLVAALADRLQGTLRAVNRHLGAVNIVAGLLLIVFGLLLLLGSLTSLNRYAPLFNL